MYHIVNAQNYFLKDEKERAANLSKTWQAYNTEWEKASEKEHIWSDICACKFPVNNSFTKWWFCFRNWILTNPTATQQLWSINTFKHFDTGRYRNAKTYYYFPLRAKKYHLVETGYMKIHKSQLSKKKKKLHLPTPCSFTNLRNSR